MDREILHLRRRSRIASPSLPLFTDDSNLRHVSVENMMTKLSQIHMQWPISTLFTLHGSRLLLPPTSSIPLVVTAMCRLHTSSGIRVACVTTLTAAPADLKHTALQVVLPLARALTSHWTNLRLLSKTPLHYVLQASALHSIAGRSGLHLERHKTTNQLLVVVSSFNVLIVRRTVVQVHSCELARRLHCHMASAPMQNHRTKGKTANCEPNKNTVKWNISVDGVHTSSSASEFVKASKP